MLKKAISVIYLLEIGLTFREKSLKIVLTEGWQSGNAPDSKSGEPANTGAQVQILYLPYINISTIRGCEEAVLHQVIRTAKQK